MNVGIGRWVKRGAALVGGVILAGLFLPYALTPFYHYPPPAPFAGPRWFNPYAGMQGSWHQVALHDHGLTCCLPSVERRSDLQMAAYYHALGYDVALVADHQRLSYLPGPSLYEHGANVLKSHQLVVGARHVNWLDFPLFQSTDDKQYVLDSLRGDAALVGIAHPEIRNGYSFADLRRLTGYDFMEIVHEDAVYAPWWDAALSAGRLSWATGSDDAHGLTRPNKMGLGWTMLRTSAPTPTQLVHALRVGWGYAVVGQHGHNDIMLRDVDVRGDTLVVATDPGALSFTFVGQGGQVRSVVHASAGARYLLRPEDTYVRTVVRTPHTALYLNPVVRSRDGERPVLAAARLDLAATWGARSALLAAAAALCWAFARRRARRRASDPSAAPPSPRRRRRQAA